MVSRPLGPDWYKKSGEFSFPSLSSSNWAASFHLTHLLLRVFKTSSQPQSSILHRIGVFLYTGAVCCCVLLLINRSFARMILSPWNPEITVTTNLMTVIVMTDDCGSDDDRKEHGEVKVDVEGEGWWKRHWRWWQCRLINF